MGPTKQAEYRRSAELFEKIFKEKGAHYALALLSDSGYENKDLKEVLKYLIPKKFKTWQARNKHFLNNV